jgi:hypothetical protein
MSLALHLDRLMIDRACRTIGLLSKAQSTTRHPSSTSHGKLPPLSMVFCRSILLRGEPSYCLDVKNIREKTDIDHIRS